MAKAQKSAAEFIKETFSPNVGVIASPDAETICQKNHLSFVELLNEYGRQYVDGKFTDANGLSAELSKFFVTYKDATVPPPQPTLGLRRLSEAVGNCVPLRVDENDFLSSNYDFAYPDKSPWYEQYRELFLSIITPGEHEFTKHFAACIFVVSSTNPDPMQQFATMMVSQHQQQQQNPSKLPRWFSSDLLRYYVLIRDCVDSEDERAEAYYQSMRAKYGVHSCYLLKINSVSPNEEMKVDQPTLSDFISQTSQESSMTDTSSETKLNGGFPEVFSGDGGLHPLQDHPLSGSRQRHRSNSGHIRRPRTKSSCETACCLNADDKNRVKNLGHVFASQALIPWAERVIRSLTDLYNSKRKGGIFKNLFKGAKPDVKPTSAYSLDSTEMQFRRLADLCFMFQIYEFAYQVYHSLKRDFESDKAWIYCAGAQEMAALSVFMQGTQTSRQYPLNYMDGAISVYQSCKAQQFATRAVLLSTDVLKSKNMWTQAAQQYLKLTNDDTDLRSALLLEQAAYCHVNMSPRQIRKYAFYMILAGNRYSKCGQRKHALRCYKSGVQIYNDKKWSNVENHINLTISRLSAQLNEPDEALHRMSKLVTENNESASQQSIYLREYCTAVKAVQDQKGVACLDVAIPAVVKNEVMVTTDQFDEPTNTFVYYNDSTWSRLEESCIEKSQGSLPMIINYSIPSYNKTMKNTQPVKSTVNEIQFIRVSLSNPLRVILSLTNITLDWRFKPDDAEDFTVNSQSEDAKQYVQHTPIETLQLEGPKRTWVLFKMVPLQRGTLSLQSVSFTINYIDSSGMISYVRGRQMLEVSGPRLNGTLTERTSKQYGPDQRLNLQINPPAPRIKAVFEGMPSHIKLDEVVKVKVTVTNVGPVALKNLFYSTNQPEALVYRCEDEREEVRDWDNEQTQYKSVCSIDIPNNALESNSSVQFYLWVRGTHTVSERNLYLLIYYEPHEQIDKKIRHRCSRWGFGIRTLPSILTRVNLQTRHMNTEQDMNSCLFSLSIHNVIQPNRERTQEFSILQLKCLSNTWKLSTNHSQDNSVVVNQSEIALLSSGLQHLEDNSKFVISDRTYSAEDSGISEQLLRDMIYRRIWAEPVPDNPITYNPDIAVVFAVVWKCMDLDSSGNSNINFGVHLSALNSERKILPKPPHKDDSNTGVVFSLKSHNRQTRGEQTQTIQYYLKYKSQHKVNLEQSRLYQTPVQLVIKSFCEEEQQISIETNSSEKYEHYSWSGRTHFTADIEPNQILEYTLHTTFYEYGVFNLNTLTLFCPSNKVQIKNTLPDTALITIEKS